MSLCRLCQLARGGITRIHSLSLQVTPSRCAYQRGTDSRAKSGVLRSQSSGTNSGSAAPSVVRFYDAPPGLNFPARLAGLVSSFSDSDYAPISGACQWECRESGTEPMPGILKIQMTSQMAFALRVEELHHTIVLLRSQRDDVRPESLIFILVLLVLEEGVEPSYPVKDAGF